MKIANAIRWYVVAGISFFLLDRITKSLALLYCQEPCFAGNPLSFVLAVNRGVTWGMFNHLQGYRSLLLLTLIIAVTVSVASRARMRYQQGHSIWPEVLVIAGSCSNIFDRFVYD